MLEVEPPIEHGPAPNYSVPLPTSMAGLFEPDQLARTYGRRPADALANVDLAAFVQLMQQQFSPSVRLCRLAVPERVLLSEALLRAIRSRS